MQSERVAVSVDVLTLRRSRMLYPWRPGLLGSILRAAAMNSRGHVMEWWIAGLVIGVAYLALAL
jgi:hypothetical protein